MAVQAAKGLVVYQTAYVLVVMVFLACKRVSSEERWALTGQNRRSSVSVFFRLREAWAKRRYAAYFSSKLTDGVGESNEKDSYLDFATDYENISFKEHRALTAMIRSVGRLLGGGLRAC